MNVWDFFWSIGEILSLIALGCGAFLSLLEVDPLASLVMHLKPLVFPEFHVPLNHRLVDFDHHEAEW